MDAMTQSRIAADQLSGGPRDEAGRRPYASLVAFYDRIGGMFTPDDAQGEVSAKASRRAGLLRSILSNPKSDRDYRRALDIYAAMAARHPERIWYRTDAIDTLREYAHSLDALARPADADAALHEALAIAEGLLDSSDVAQACFRLTLVDQFDALARTLLDPSRSRPDDPARALQLARWAVEGDPDRGSFRTTLALAQYRAGDAPSAARSLDEAIRLQDATDPEDWLRTSPLRPRVDRRAAPPRTWVIAHLSPEPLSPGCRRLLTEVESLLTLASATSVNLPPGR